MGIPRGMWKTGYGAYPHYSEETWTRLSVPREGKKGLQSVVESLWKAGLLEPCMCPYDTVVLPGRESDGTYRMVQDY